VFNQLKDSDRKFLGLAHTVSTWSKCATRHIGAVIVVNNIPVSSGYNGTVIGGMNCNEGGCPRCERRVQGLLQSGDDIASCLCAHAETNAIAFAARHGISVQGGIMYCWCGVPCASCSKVIVNAGISKVVCLFREQDYDPYGVEILKAGRVEILKFEERPEKPNSE